MSDNNESTYRVEIFFEPNISLVSVVRHFVMSFYERVLGNPEISYRMALATHELLDNAVQHSTTSRTGVKISAQPLPGGEYRLAVKTQNAAGPDSLASLEKALRGLQEAEDPFEHYLHCVRKTATRIEGSGLGLPRIAAEAAMNLSLETNGDEVVVTAETTVRKGVS